MGFFGMCATLRLFCLLYPLLVLAGSNVFVDVSWLMFKLGLGAPKDVDPEVMARAILVWASTLSRKSHAHLIFLLLDSKPGDGKLRLSGVQSDKERRRLVLNRAIMRQGGELHREGNMRGIVIVRGKAESDATAAEMQAFADGVYAWDGDWAFLMGLAGLTRMAYFILYIDLVAETVSVTPYGSLTPTGASATVDYASEAFERFASGGWEHGLPLFLAILLFAVVVGCDFSSVLNIGDATFARQFLGSTDSKLELVLSIIALLAWRSSAAPPTEPPPQLATRLLELSLKGQLPDDAGERATALLELAMLVTTAMLRFLTQFVYTLVRQADGSYVFGPTRALFDHYAGGELTIAAQGAPDEEDDFPRMVGENIHELAEAQGKAIADNIALFGRPGYDVELARFMSERPAEPGAAPAPSDDAETAKANQAFCTAECIARTVAEMKVDD